MSLSLSGQMQELDSRDSNMRSMCSSRPNLHLRGSSTRSETRVKVSLQVSKPSICLVAHRVQHNTFRFCRNGRRSEATSEPIGDYTHVSSSEGPRNFEDQDDVDPSFPAFAEFHRETRSSYDPQGSTSSTRIPQVALNSGHRIPLGRLSNNSPLDLISEAAQARPGPSSNHSKHSQSQTTWLIRIAAELLQPYYRLNLLETAVSPSVYLLDSVSDQDGSTNLGLHPNWM